MHGQYINQSLSLKQCFPDDTTDLQQREAVFCPLFNVGQKQVIAHRHPYLSQHRVFACSQKRFDFQVLFDPLEKQFDLPARLVDSRYSRCRQLEVVGKKCQRLVLFFIVIPDKPQLFGVFGLCQWSLQRNALVA